MVLEEVADIGSDLMTKSAALMKGPVQGMAIPTTGVLTYEDLDLQFQMLLNDLEPWTKYVLNYRVSKKNANLVKIVAGHTFLTYNFFFQLKLNQQAFDMLKQRPLLTKLAIKNGEIKKSRIIIVAAGVSIDKKETNVLMDALEAVMAGYSM